MTYQNESSVPPRWGGITWHQHDQRELGNLLKIQSNQICQASEKVHKMDFLAFPAGIEEAFLQVPQKAAQSEKKKHHVDGLVQKRRNSSALALICIWQNFKLHLYLITAFGVFDKYIFKYTFSKHHFNRCTIRRTFPENRLISSNFYQNNCIGLIHCGLMTPYGGLDMGQHWLR